MPSSVAAMFFVRLLPVAATALALSPVNDSTLLTRVPMIMAHDAGSGYLGQGIVNAWTKTQSGGLLEQLECGARAFDARPLLDPKAGLIWHHGGVRVDYSFNRSLLDVVAWCGAHPAELVLLMVWDCEGDGCMRAVGDSLAQHGVANIATCARLEGLTLGRARQLGALSGGGSLLAFTGPSAPNGAACSVANYDPSQACCLPGGSDLPHRCNISGQPGAGLSEDELRRCAAEVQGGLPGVQCCWRTDKDRDVPVARMFKYLDGVSAGGLSDALFTQAQALWQEGTESVVIGTLRGSSLVIDEVKSGLNALIAGEVRKGRWANLNFLEVNDVCDGGPELLAALRARSPTRHEEAPSLVYLESSDPEGLAFFLVGDWGGGGNQPEGPLGSRAGGSVCDGSKDHSVTTTCQVATAAGLKKVAATLSPAPQFVLGLGDNFYRMGINPFNQFRFQSTFEHVYAGIGLPWYQLAGNHDHGGLIQYQIAYSKKSTLWKYPARYYVIRAKIPGTTSTVDIVVFDSVILLGMSEKFANGTVGAPVGPEDHTAAETQWQWIEEQLASSHAEFLFTAAHYPVFSVCEHGPTQSLVARLRPLMQKHRVNGHLAGHDHCLEHILDGDSAHIVSGAGAQAWYAPHHADKIAPATLAWGMTSANAGARVGGFAAMRIATGSASVSYYDDTGALLYVSPSIKPRSAANEGQIRVLV